MSFKLLTSHKCKRRSPNKIHLYIADGKRFLLVYCKRSAIVTQLNIAMVPCEINNPSKVPLLSKLLVLVYILAYVRISAIYYH